MTALEEFMKDSLDNPKPLFKDFCWHFQPEIYYVIDTESEKIILAFLDKSILSHESLMFLVKYLNGKVNYKIINKDTYEESQDE